MIGLIVASVVCWAIIFEKYYAIARARKASQNFEQMFWSGQSLEDLYLTLGPRGSRACRRCSWRRCANGSAARKARSRPASRRAEGASRR
jgi:biopolymer transport protein ExbB/TolQ